MAASMRHQRDYVISTYEIKTSAIKENAQNFRFQCFKRVYESMKMSLYSPVAAASEPAGSPGNPE